MGCNENEDYFVLFRIVSYDSREHHLPHRHCQDQTAAAGSGHGEEVGDHEVPGDDQLSADHHEGGGRQGSVPGSTTVAVRVTATGSRTRSHARPGARHQNLVRSYLCMGLLNTRLTRLNSY